ncbi:hypothetical protein EBQ24_00465 [Allofranklinella schreckenbergeri]|uniref:Uncharacterized protein n=1 Tax=Allofranklinella schreckenbergeri TaxID=1076744 RepID=A0A3M6R9U9_9BURK|nr:hypothetical protein [Allofranklinella schreckenbergeri]RMX11758.1 hypothetical protein EBQ24_00465 [Allofranklinella schreckenbergeri]
MKSQENLNPKATQQDGLALRLGAAIADCYEAFSRYRAPAFTLDVCMPCCVEPEMEEQLRHLPLRQLTPKHLYEYNNSAKNDVQSIAEVGYFLPRLLELIAQGKEVHHSTELYLDRLGRCPRDSISPAQWQAVQAVAQALFADCLARYPWERGGPWNGCTLFDVLRMLHIGGLDIQPLLDLWLRTATPQATLHYANAAWFDYWLDGGRVNNAFVKDRPDYITCVDKWMRHEAHRLLFSQRLLALETARIPHFDQWKCGCRFTPAQVIQNCIDAMRLDGPESARQQRPSDEKRRP